MLICSVLFFLDGSLNLVECLLDKRAILYVENAIGVALDLRVMRNHHASCSAVLTLALRSNAVDVQDKVHDGHYKKKERSYVSNIG